MQAIKALFSPAAADIPAPSGSAAPAHGRAGITLTFPSIAPGTKLLPTQKHPGLGHTTKSTIEGSSHTTTHLVQDHHANAFVGAVVQAWSGHYPLELTAGDFWLLVLQGVARHVAANSELLRHKFVNFEGKKKLEVSADDFVRGNPNNDWGRLFGDFVSQIDSNTKAGVVPAMEASFTTTTPLERLAGRITIMDVCKSFFEYGFTTCCGFPSVTLLGTRADWVALDAKLGDVLVLCEDGFVAKWGAALRSVTGKFVQAFDGEADFAFWQSMAKRGGTTGSGSMSWYTGWVNVFMPYISGGGSVVLNRYCEPYSPDQNYVKSGLKEAYYSSSSRDGPPREQWACGPDVNMLLPALAEAPAEWTYFGTKIDVLFRGGFVGFTQDPASLAVRPALGWLVVDA